MVYQVGSLHAASGDSSKVCRAGRAIPGKRLANTYVSIKLYKGVAAESGEIRVSFRFFAASL